MSIRLSLAYSLGKQKRGKLLCVNKSNRGLVYTE